VADAQATKIVVVEDDEPILQLVQTFLRSGGYQVAGTSEPLEAAALVRREAPDLVLCDIAMPGLDGYGVVRALQADPETARCPVVFLTAHREFTERVQAFRFGVVDYLTKPFTRELLLRRVERLLQDLGARPGVVTEAGSGAAARLLEEAHREGRSGVLSVPGASGEAHVLVRAGQVLGRTPAGETEAARFEELDPSREEIVGLEPGEAPAEGAALPPFDELPSAFKTALVVDDNAFFRRFLREVLEAQGFTVHEAKDGGQALEVALEKRPWLILTDAEMPVMDGFELCRRVRRHSLIRHTPLLFLSGWDDFKNRVRGLEAGGDEYLSKATPVRELLMRVRLLMRRFGELEERSRAGPGVSGALELVGVPNVLQMCHAGRLTGVLTAHAGTDQAFIRFRQGEIVGAEVAEARGEDAVMEFLAWERGGFEFLPGEQAEGAPLGGRFDQLLLEGCRRLDERNRS
jgi:DNA-binding response OmpR family regulator